MYLHSVQILKYQTIDTDEADSSDNSINYSCLRDINHLDALPQQQGCINVCGIVHYMECRPIQTSNRQINRKWKIIVKTLNGSTVTVFGEKCPFMISENFHLYTGQTIVLIDLHYQTHQYNQKKHVVLIADENTYICHSFSQSILQCLHEQFRLKSTLNTQFRDRKC